MAHTPVYLDYHATTPVDPRVVEAMLPYFTEHFGNPASASHAWGWKAQEAVEQARREVATVIGAAAREIVFTSGATESNNLAIKGSRRWPRPIAAASRHVGDRAQVGARGVASGSARPGGGCTVAAGPDAMAASIWRHCGPRSGATRRSSSVMAANNEIGVVQPLAEIGAIAHAAGALFHVDAAQAVGKIPIDVERDEHRSALAHRSQDVRAERLRCVLRAEADASSHR